MTEMLCRYVELETYIHSAMMKCEYPIDILSLEEQRIVKDILSILQASTDVITEVSGDCYPTVSLIIPITL